MKSLFQLIRDALLWRPARRDEPIRRLALAIEHSQAGRIAELAAKAAVCAGSLDMERALAGLTRAFLKGFVGPNELRSIAEQAPGIMLVLADGLLLTSQEIVARAHRKTLTADCIAIALLNQQHRIDYEAKKLKNGAWFLRGLLEGD